MQTEVIACLPASTLTKKQVKKFRAEFGDNVIIAEVRHDDECGNGHNTFAITAEIYEPYMQRGEATAINAKGRTVWLNSCGCCHEEVAKHFPLLAPFIKWHLTSTDGPMHYLASTIYHAGDRDCDGKRKGERWQIKGHEEKRVVFAGFPITFEFKREMIAFIESAPNWASVEPVPVEHEKDPTTNYKFDPKWTLTGLTLPWYKCPFDRQEEAQEFLEACRQLAPKITVFQEKFTKVGKGKERELNAARTSAVWPDATDEELSVEPDELKAALLARLPALMAEFKQAVESLGFVY